MPTYTYYWPEWACEDARAVGLEGKPIAAFFGGQNADSNFSRFKVGVGDTVVAITIVDGRVHLLASLVVTHKVSADEWLKAHPDHRQLRLSRHGSQVLGGTPGAVLSFSRQVPTAVLEAWRYDSGKAGRPLALEDGRVSRRLSMQGVYRLNDATAKRVEKLLSAKLADEPKRDGDVDALEAALRAKPDDAATAAVLADRWQDLGDPRGELLALELALWHAKPEETGPAWERLSEAVKKRPLAKVLKQPGGFPFRAGVGTRPRVRWRVSWVELGRPISWEELEATIRPWANVLKVNHITRSWGRPPEVDLTFEAQLRLRYPGTQVELPFQGKPFLELGEQRLALNRSRLDLCLAIPLSQDPTLVKRLVSAARASLPPFDPGKGALMQCTWEGRAARQVRLPPL